MIKDSVPIPASVLIVDHRPTTRIALTAALDGMDIEIVTAASGTEALHKLLEQNFAVVLLDVNMPIMDGFETAKMIRLQPGSEHLPIVFITAERLTEDAQLKGYELGAVDYIFSPVLPQILRAKVAMFADLYRLRGYVDELMAARATALQQQNAQLQAGRVRMERQLDEMRRFQKVAVGRELRMQEMKEENRALKTRVAELQKKT